MNNDDKIKQLKEAYFEGKLSKEETKWLKENSDDAYFNTLKDAKEETMDWHFEEFLEVAEESTPKRSIFSYHNYYWAAASIALIVFATFFLLNEGKEAPRQHAKEADKKPTELQNIDADTIVHEIVDEPKEQPKRVKTNKIKPKETPISNEPVYNPEYVVINGKPIYDLEEAKELTMNSLSLLASNVEKSVSGMENVKHLSIKF